MTFFGRSLINNIPVPPPLYSDDFKKNSGAWFFGIDMKYLVEVQKKEVFHLVEHGFSHKDLMNMPIEERRFYFHLLLKKMNPDDN